MKIRVAVLEQDVNYLNRVVAILNTKYADKLEVYSFTNPEIALASLSDINADLLLAGETFEINAAQLPKRCSFAYLVSANNIDSYNGQAAIGKFQKADLIYKRALSIVAENASAITGIRSGNAKSKTVALLSPAGGVGTSTLAAACALHYAAQGKNVLFLSLDPFGTPDLFFSGEGQLDMSDIVFAIKSKRASLPMKLESAVRKDARGVSFFFRPKLPLDLMELTGEEKTQLIRELQLSGAYDNIILDADFGMDADSLALYRKLDALILVGNGAEGSNIKLQMALECIRQTDMRDKGTLWSSVCLMYNRFREKAGQTIAADGVRMLGALPELAVSDRQVMLSHLSANAAFDGI